jgi:hypothetical protein
MKKATRDSIGRRLLLVAVTLFLSACNGNGVQTIPVRGRVTHGGGAWPVEGTLYFIPIQTAGTTMRPGMAKFTKEGEFAARTFTDGDGLIPGKYAIKVECWEHPPSMDPNAPEAKSYVPAAIQAGTAEGWQVEVGGDQKVVELTLDVPK